ncbi:MAG: beta-lactamase family protein [Acidobacteria bacterium]|nr:beta-lactamase family protein [Acidobacteriota bacterium]
MRRPLVLLALAFCAVAPAGAQKAPAIDSTGREAIAKLLPPDAIFRIFSMTKPVTSAAAMLLVEEKRLGLDDPIAKHLSAKDANQAVVMMDQTGHFVTRPPATPVTVRHLLTHTSGIAYAFSNEVLSKVQETAPSIPDTSILVHDPGERWTYGPSTKVLGDIVAAVSGQSLDVFLDERIFKPLAMNDTGFSIPGDKLARLATSHQRRDGKLVEQPNPATAPHQVRGDSGLYSTASDYGRFLRMLLNGGELDGRRVLSEATVREMTTNQIGALKVETQPAVNPAFSSAFPKGGGRDAWGFGFQIARPETPDPRRRSPGSLSWSGAMNTHFWVDPERRIGAVLLVQILPFGDAKAMQLLDEFEAAVYAALE